MRFHPTADRATGERKNYGFGNTHGRPKPPEARHGHGTRRAVAGLLSLGDRVLRIGGPGEERAPGTARGDRRDYAVLPALL